ncbi:extracellular ligand-binding receptor [Tanacetum coccineum]
MEIKSRKLTEVFLIIMLICFQICSKAQEDSSYKEIPVGVILDMGSWVGKIVHSCMNMALSEFYTVNNHYKTRMVLHSRDTHGEPLHALSAALDLLEKQKVQAIIASESATEAKFLAVLGDEARVPILSFSPTPSSYKHPYLLQVSQDETTQFKAIAAMAESFKWKNVILICEDAANEIEVAKFMTNTLQEKKISVTYMSLISTASSNELVYEELHKLSAMQTNIYIMHACHSLASSVLSKAKYLGLMDVGYKWIITSKTMDFFDFMDGEVVESMQGVVAFRSYIPQSSDLHKFTLKWRKEHHAMDPMMELKKINPYGVWAYDAVSALGMAIERTQTVGQVLKSNIKNGESSKIRRDTSLMDQMLRISFRGLAGTFQLMNGRMSIQVLEIINVIGNRERRVGFWTKGVGLTRQIDKLNSIPYIIWPGELSMEYTSIRDIDPNINAAALRVGSKNGVIDVIVMKFLILKFLAQYPSGLLDDFYLNYHHVLACESSLHYNVLNIRVNMFTPLLAADFGGRCFLVGRLEEDVNPFGGGNPLLTKETESEPIIWDIGDEEEEYPFVNEYPSFKKEPIMFVEDESCPVYDTDNEEEESMPVYDTDIEDVIEEEEGFVGKGGFGGEEDNIEDVVVVANDLCSSMIQTILSVDFEKYINTKSHELMSFEKSIIIKVSQSSFKFLICKKYQEWYLKAPPMVDKLGFKTIKVRGRVVIKKENLMQGIQIWMLCVQGTSEANSRMIFSQVEEDDAD